MHQIYLKKERALNIDTKSFLAFSCVHCPLQDAEAVDFLLHTIGKLKPDVIVHLGDGHEADSASRWPNEYDWSLSEEFKSHNEFLKSIRKASPKSRRIFLPGNHDDNLQSINRIDIRLRNLCDYNEHEPELREHWEQPINYVYSRRRGVWRLGQVTFCHGYEASASADELQSILLGMPYGLFVGGHTHKPLDVTQAYKTRSIPLPYWYANTGCMRDMKPVWMARKRTHQWGQAITVGKASIVKSPRMSRQWDAQTIIFKSYNESQY